GVVNRRLAVYPRQVQALFAQDALLAQMGVEAYAGAPLFDTARKPLGLLAVLFRKPLAGTTLVESALQICAARVAAEMERQQAEAALRQSEARFRTLTSLAPVGIFLADPEGNCLFVNERWQEMAGLTAEEARGRGWTRALHPEDRARVEEEWYVAAAWGR